MTYTPLLHELHSILFAALVHIIHAIASGERLTRSDLLARLPLQDRAHTEREEALIDTLFHFGEQGYAELLVNTTLCLPPTTTERIWLKTMLLDPRAGYLLASDLRVRLLERLDSVAALPDNIWERVQNVGDNIAPATLRTVWQAVTRGRCLYIESRARTGVSYEQTIVPIRLEYDMAANRYHIIAYLAAEHRAIKISLSRVTTVRLVDEPVPANSAERFAEFIESRRRTATIRILPRYNAPDRALTMLASYDRHGTYDEATGEYTLTLDYYDFDEPDLIGQIMSLGAAAIVLGSPELREQVIARLRRRVAALSSPRT